MDTEIFYSIEKDGKTIHLSETLDKGIWKDLVGGEGNTRQILQHSAIRTVGKEDVQKFLSVVDNIMKIKHYYDDWAVFYRHAIHLDITEMTFFMA